MSENQEKSIRRQLREAQARLELKRLEHEERLLEWWGNAGWGMGWNSWPNPFDQPLGPIGPDGRIWIPVAGGRPDDRRDGANRPFVWTDIDLDRARGLARWLCTSNPIACGALECLADYTARTGFQYEARPGKRFLDDLVAKELSEQAQEVVDEFRLINRLGEGEEEITWADREWEAVLRSVRDGEALIRTFPQPDGSTLARWLEPEQIRQPPGSGPEYTFGKRNAPGDAERTLAYAVSYEGPHDWEEVPSCEVAHLRLNTDSCIKRGLSDFYSTGQALEEVWKLLRAMRVSGTAQASIAWIEKYQGATQESLNSLVSKARSLNPPTMTDPFTGRETSSQKLEPGQRLMVGSGRDYVPAPLAANTTQHISIVQACLRAVGARWRMPEYMISGDASNANYASTLVSGSPFVVRVECRQAVYGRFFLRVMWQAVRNAANAGRFRVGGRIYTYEELSRLIDINPTPPQVAIADKAVESQVDSIDIQNGAMSLQTRRARRGLDNDTERRNLAEEPPTRISGKVTDLDAEGDPIRPGQGEGGSQQGNGPFFPRVAGGDGEAG